MKITIIHRYFWPDNAPYAQMLFKIAKALSSAGHQVSVLTSQPSHNWSKKNSVPRREEVDGVAIQRFSLLPEFGRKTLPRALNIVIFSVEIFIYLLFHRADIIMVATTPPVIMAFIVRLVSRLRKFKYIYHCQDIHPEAMVLINAMSNGYFYRLLKQIDSKNVREASAVIVLSNDMKNTLNARNISSENIHTLNNFIFDNSVIGRSNQNLDSEYFNILFAGNLGRFQDLDIVIEAAKLLKKNKKIRFNFLGDGLERANLEKSASELLDDTVFFHGHVSVSDALGYMKNANIGLITIADQIINVAYPSKTMMYLSTGLPILAVLESNSELCQLVNSEHLGYTCQTRSSKSLAQVVEKAYADRRKLSYDRERIRTVANKLFSEEVVLQQWVDLYEGISA